jgi:hypothetical protein
VSRVLLSIGCDAYSHLDGLDGAERDSERIFQALVEDAGDYDRDLSVSLRSPTMEEIDRAIEGLFDLRDLDILTFFFAGHGGVKYGTSYLCPSNTRPDRLSATALSLPDLLTKLAELRPRQVNVVMDSCQSGGAMLDMNSLLKPEVLTGLNSPSISFLAAAAPDQYAGEEDEGGFATLALLRYLSGEEMLQDNRPYLDLVEIGRAVSESVGSTVPEQTPVTWGLNLYGQGEFASNPFFPNDPTRRRPPVEIAPGTAAGSKVQEYSEALWHHYQSLAAEPSYGDLADLLRIVCEDIEEGGTSALPFVRGMATSFRARSSSSPDLLAESDVLASCAIALLPFQEDGAGRVLARELMAERRSVDDTIRAALTESSSSDRYALLSPSAPLGDFYYLPLRVSRILGWLASTILVDDLLGAEDRAGEDVRRTIALVVDAYEGSLVALSDEQAPHVFLLAKACQLRGWEDLGRRILRPYFDSLESVGGSVSRAGLESAEAFRYVMQRAAGQLGQELKILAGPSQFIPSLMVAGAAFGLDGEWNRRLLAFDGRYLDLYLPHDYREFGAKNIQNGTNINPRVGHDFWTLSDLVEQFKATHCPAMASNEAIRATESRGLCVLAAYLLPDRMPYFLECDFSEI